MRINRKQTLLLLLLFLLSFCLGASQKLPKLTPAKVTRVVDGDTIVVNFNKKVKKVRFIGVNCPETVRRH